VKADRKTSTLREDR